ncbi:DUF1134 domain-containing protein [Kaistia adipata]|uniref:DUF1134 domain-containing protein n=1 Tax=Kaistia adipata TaxID=166954 RepID=UPI00040A1AF8|nr:EipA family protein [Kaistia adipata]
MHRSLRLTFLIALIALAAPFLALGSAKAQSPDRYSSDELINTGHSFFGEVSGSLASVVEHAVSKYGLPNGYILGEQGSGALFAGLRYGNGTLYTKNAGQHQVFFQGPSLGWDIGGDGSRVMMLVYNLPSVSALYTRYGGVNGSAYLVGGVGMTVLSRNDVFIVPIVSGVGARLGLNVGYLKFTDRQTWNPF